MGFVTTKLPVLRKRNILRNFFQASWPFKHMTPPNRWCGAQSSISQAEAVFPPKARRSDKKMLEKIVLVKRFPLDFCEQVAGWFIGILILAETKFRQVAG